MVGGPGHVPLGFPKSGPVMHRIRWQSAAVLFYDIVAPSRQLLSNFFVHLFH